MKKTLATLLLLALCLSLALPALASGPVIEVIDDQPHVQLIRVTANGQSTLITIGRPTAESPTEYIVTVGTVVYQINTAQTGAEAARLIAHLQNLGISPSIVMQYIQDVAVISQDTPSGPRQTSCVCFTVFCSVCTFTPCGGAGCSCRPIL